MPDNVADSAESTIYVFQTELPTFAFGLLRQRYAGDLKIDRDRIPVELLDSYADALLRVFSESPLLGTVSLPGGEETVGQISGGYGLRVKQTLADGRTARITFFQIRPLLVPIGLDLVSLTLAILTSPATAVLPTADAIYNFTKAVIQLDREKGDGTLIDAYHAFLTAKSNNARKKIEAAPTSEQILALLPEWPAPTLTAALTALAAKNIIKRQSASDNDGVMETAWIESF